MRRILAAAVLVTAAFALGNAGSAAGQPATTSNTYVSPPIEGLVVSAATGRPVGGAPVFAFWIGPLVPEVLVNTLHVSEAVTAADGRFTVPGWRRTVKHPVEPERSGLWVVAPGHTLTHTSLKDLTPGRRVRIELAPAPADPARRAERLRNDFSLLVLILASLPRGPSPKIVDVLVAEAARLPEELREGLPDRAGFEWMVNEFRAFYEQAAAGAEGRE